MQGILDPLTWLRLPVLANSLLMGEPARLANAQQSAKYDLEMNRRMQNERRCRKAHSSAPIFLPADRAYSGSLLPNPDCRTRLQTYSSDLRLHSSDLRHNGSLYCGSGIARYKICVRDRLDGNIPERIGKYH